jgi:hypothetical protein
MPNYSELIRYYAKQNNMVQKKAMQEWSKLSIQEKD